MAESTCCELATQALISYYQAEYELIYGAGGLYEQLQKFEEPEYSLRLAILNRAVNHIDSAVRKALKVLACSDCSPCARSAIVAIPALAVLGIRAIGVLILDPKLSSEKCGDLNKLINGEVVNTILGIRYILKFVFCPEDRKEKCSSISESCTSTPSESCFSYSSSSSSSCTKEKKEKCHKPKPCKKPVKPCLPCQRKL